MNVLHRNLKNRLASLFPILVMFGLALGSAPAVAQACQDGYYRFVDHNDFDKARGWRGRGGDWGAHPPGISVFMDLNRGEYNAMNSRRASQLDKRRTEVGFIPCNAINGVAAYTASPNDPDNSQWWNPGAAKHGVINGIAPNSNFPGFRDNVAPPLAGAARRVNKTN